MKNKIVFLFILNLSVVFGQTTIGSFEYLGEVYGDRESYIGFNPMWTMLKNKQAPYPERHNLNGLSFDFTYKVVRTNKGELRFNYNNKALGDLVYLYIQTKKAKNNENYVKANENTTLSNLIGFFDFTWNLTGADKRWQVSLGFNANDYAYGGMYTVDSLGGSLKTMDPQGWYWAAGPQASLQVILSKAFLMEMSGGYSFSYWHPINLSYAHLPSKSYPMPHFGQLKVEMQSKWGVFASGHYNWIHNRGPIPSAGTRFDLILGFRFMMDKR